jgi:hypothetical protein
MANNRTIAQSPITLAPRALIYIAILLPILLLANAWLGIFTFNFDSKMSEIKNVIIIGVSLQ